MKIKSGVFEILNEKGVVNLKKAEIPRDASYFLKRVMADLVEKAKPYFEEKQGIIDKYKGTKNGKTFIRQEYIEIYISELSKIQKTEIDIGFEKMDINLNDLPGSVSVMQIEFLENFFNIKQEINEESK